MLTLLNLLWFKSLQTWTSPFYCLISFSETCPTVMQFCITCGAAQHILSSCQRCCCVNYFGDVVWIRCIIALKCAMSAHGPLIWNLTDGFLQPAQYVEVTSLTSDVITAKEMRERTKKQSPQTVITSHFGGAENKGIGMKENIKYYTAVDGRLRCNKSFSLYGFQLIQVYDSAHGAAVLGGLDALSVFHTVQDLW